MKKKSIITIAIIAILGFGFYKKVYIPKHTFITTTSQKGDMSVTVNGVGNIDARDIYKIGSVYGGKVLGFDITEGSFVRKGTLLATIDSVDLKDKINELKATIKKLNSDIKSLQIDKKSAISTAKYQEEIFKKNQQLYKKRAISQLDFQKYTTNNEVAKLKVESINSKVYSLISQKEQLKANQNGLNERLKRYSIVAPVSGYITKKIVSNFQIIMSNQTLLEIIDPKDVWVATHIDTRMSNAIKIGSKTIIKLRSSDKKYEATVVNIKPYNNNITYEREIDVAFDNLPIPFYMQEQAIVDININSLKNITKVPNKALSFYDKKEGVWLLKGQKVEFKPINIIARGENTIATKDISSSDRLVIEDPKKKPLSNGMTIYLK
jgi:RND family efflux transporter MFP subunit